MARGLTTAPSSRRDAAATSSTAESKASAFARDGFRKPLTFLTNWRAAARISSSVAGSSGRRNVLMLRHMMPTIPGSPV